ncbi:hypothetical protein [Methylocella silvestris]|nr:hypothetical protein [Methylocella silvestris]
MLKKIQQRRRSGVPTGETLDMAICAPLLPTDFAPAPRAALALLVAAAFSLAAPPLAAQTADPTPAPSAAPAPAPARQKTAVEKRNPAGSPLDTLLNTKLWPDVPEAKDFVKEARPDPDSLSYQPTWGAEPTRPKPRNPAELDTLRRELSGAEASNKARGVIPPAGAQQ